MGNNYKTCLPDTYDSLDNTCTLIWLPTGAQKNCVALWNDCTNDPDSCCGPAECTGDSEYAVCVPADENDTDIPSMSPSGAPSSSPSGVPSSSPTLPTCIVCDNEPSGNMSDK